MEEEKFVRDFVQLTSGDFDKDDIRSLFEKSLGEKIDCQDKDGKTVLHRAVVLENHKDVVELLLYAGINVDLQDSRGFTALHLAVLEEKIEIVELLLKCKAKIDLKDNIERTALRLAALKKNESIFKLLLNYGASLDGRSNLTADETRLGIALLYGAYLKERSKDQETKKSASPDAVKSQGSKGCIIS